MKPDSDGGKRRSRPDVTQRDREFYGPDDFAEPLDIRWILRLKNDGEVLSLLTHWRASDPTPIRMWEAPDGTAQIACRVQLMFDLYERWTAEMRELGVWVPSVEQMRRGRRRRFVDQATELVRAALRRKRGRQ